MRLGGELVEPDRRARGEPVALGQHRDQSVAAHDALLDALAPYRRDDERDVELAELETLELRVGRRARETHLDAGLGAAPAVHDLRQGAGDREVVVADPDLADPPGRGAPADVDRPVDAIERVPRLVDEHRTGRRQAHAPRGAMEQREAELPLEPRDAARQRGLCDVQALGGTREAQLVGHGQERAQVGELDAHRVRRPTRA